MSAYSTIVEELNKYRRDILFSPSLLDELNEEERKQIEEKIIKLCLKGDKACFKYIEHLKYFNPTEAFTIYTMKDLNNFDKATIIKTLYEMTNDQKYIYLLMELSKYDINVYSLLTLMYVLSDNKDQELYAFLEQISNTSEEYKKMFEIRCKKNQEPKNNTL